MDLHGIENQTIMLSMKQGLSFLKKARALDDYLASHSTYISSGTYKHDPFLKMQEKLSVPCTFPVSTRYLVISSAFKRARSGLKLNSAFIFQLRYSPKAFPHPCGKLIIFHPATTISQTRCSKPHATLSLWPRKVLRRTSIHSSTISIVRGQEPQCHAHCFEPPSSHLYSIGEK